MNWRITVINGKEYTDEQKQAFIKNKCGTCAQNCARGCHCLENRIMPCSFYVSDKIYERHQKSGFPIMKYQETVIHDGKRWRIVEFANAKTRPAIDKDLRLVAVQYERGE